MSSEAADPVAWLRKQVTVDLERYRGVLETWQPLAGSGPYALPPWQMLSVPNGRDDLLLVAQLEEVRDRVADCEAKLAILDEHYILTNKNRLEGYEEFSVVPWGTKGGAGDQGSGCVTCHYYGMGGVKGYGICRTVRILLSAYRHREGYDEKWGEPARSVG